MNEVLKKNIYCFIVVLCLQQTISFAQSCDSNYFSFLYNATDFNTYSKAIVAPDNSVLCLQTNKLYWHGITKFTPQGNVIFSYGYTAPFISNGNHSWTDLIFTDMATASDGNIFISGSVTKHGLFYDNTETPPPRTAAVINKIDKYGKVLWSRFFANSTTDPLEFSNVITLNNGDVIGYMTTQVALPYYGRVVCLSAEGDIKWIVDLNTSDFSSGNLGSSKQRAIIQTKNGNIVLCDVIYHYADDFTLTTLYHFIALNAADGSVVWEKSYDYGEPVFPNIISAYEFSNGDISFQTETSKTAQGNTAALNMIIDNNGNIQKLLATYNADNFLSLIDAKPDATTSDQSLLMLTADNKTLLVQIDKDGKLIRDWKYGKQDALPPTCFAKIENGYDIYLSEFSKTFAMLRTDPIGKLDCDTIPVNIQQEIIADFKIRSDVKTQNIPGPNESAYSTGFFAVENTKNTTITRSTVCQKNIACCIDVVDTININEISLCEGSSYTLPDKTVVQDSGRYYVSYKTLKGCDSVSLYHLSVYKNPSALSLGLDTCFNGDDTIQLHATDGYDKYLWMNDEQTTSSYYTAKDTGIYTVNVTNVCGNKTDSLHVYGQCDFPIYVPNAFSPNGDRLNDVFRVPALNLNRLIKFTVYNRWGKIIFQTSKINEGWDGNVNGIPQQPGIYIYYLQMENLIGKLITQKGTFTLIR